MSFVDKILEKFGYVKAGPPVVTKPYTNIYEENSEDDNRQKVLDGIPENKEFVAPSPVSAPTNQLSGDPATPLSGPDSFQRRDKEITQQPNTIDKVMNSPENKDVMTSDKYNSIVTNLMNNPRVIDVEEIDKQNHAIASKMRKLGIQFVDRDLYLAKYKEVQRKAALEKRPLSDFIGDDF